MCDGAVVFAGSVGFDRTFTLRLSENRRGQVHFAVPWEQIVPDPSPRTVLGQALGVAVLFMISEIAPGSIK